MLRTVSLIIVTSHLIACAAPSSHYQRAEGPSDVGYYQNQITENRYRITYNGSTGNDEDAVKDMALLRAAEVTKLNDYDWFRVTSRETREESDEAVDVATGISSGTRVYRSCGLLGCTTTSSPVYSQIQINSSSDRDVYSTSIEIVMGSGQVEDQTSVYNATELYDYLNARYADS